MRIVRLSLAFLAAGLLALAVPARSETTFSTAAEFALVEDYETGAVLYEKNADQPMPPASTAKLLTAEIVFHELKEGRLHLDDMFDVSENAWRRGRRAFARLRDVPGRSQPGAESRTCCAAA